MIHILAMLIIKVALACYWLLNFVPNDFVMTNYVYNICHDVAQYLPISTIAILYDVVIIFAMALPSVCQYRR